MTNIIKLGQERKNRARAKKEEMAQQNRAKFGRTKAEKSRNKKKTEQAKSHLDGHKLTD